MIDGGRGQVGAVKQALRGTALEHVPTFGMVKDDHHRTRAIVDDAGGKSPSTATAISSRL